MPTFCWADAANILKVGHCTHFERVFFWKVVAAIFFLVDATKILNWELFLQSACCKNFEEIFLLGLCYNYFAGWRLQMYAGIILKMFARIMLQIFAE